MEKEFVPYEQAVALKELGFDEPCMSSRDMNNDKGLIQLPLYQQAFRWLHEQLGMKGLMPSTDLEYRLQMLNNLIKMLSSKKKKYA
jgi:hypothetical protein